jgi:Leucine-rich repeat (LRR) protein
MCTTCIAKSLLAKVKQVEEDVDEGEHESPATKRRLVTKRRSRQRSRHILGLQLPDVNGESPEKALLDSIAQGSQNGESPKKCVDAPKVSAEGERKAREAVSATVEPGDERQALTNLFLAMRGECWAKKDGWLSASDLGDWEGVTLNNDGKVVQLDLGENNLRGTLPQSFGVLTYLRGVYFDTNFIDGSIPESIAECKQMKDVYLNSNSLTGPLPTGLCELKCLEVFNVESNKLSGELPDLGQLSHLECLDLRWNNLTGTVPLSISKCMRLEEIWMQGNQLEGKIPPALAKLPRLEWLGLSNNNFEDRDGARLMFQGHFGSEVGIFLDGDGDEFKGDGPKGGIRSTAKAAKAEKKRGD